MAIYGAGETGRRLLKILRDNRKYLPVLFIDDDINFHDTVIDSLKVHSFNSFTSNLEKNKVETVLIAIPSIDQALKQKIVAVCNNILSVKIIPKVIDLIDEKFTISDLRQLTIEDLLTRDVVPPIKGLMTQHTNGQVVVITGAGGSIESELCRQMIDLAPKHLIL